MEPTFPVYRRPEADLDSPCSQFQLVPQKNLAERGGFEPPVPKKGTPVFETGPFDRSGTSPRA